MGTCKKCSGTGNLKFPDVFPHQLNKKSKTKGTWRQRYACLDDKTDPTKLAFFKSQEDAKKYQNPTEEWELSRMRDHFQKTNEHSSYECGWELEIRRTNEDGKIVTKLRYVAFSIQDMREEFVGW